MTLIRNFYVAGIGLLALGPICSTFAIDGLHLSLETLDSDHIHAEQVAMDLDWHDTQRLSVSASANNISSDLFDSIRSLTVYCRDAEYLHQRLHCPRGTLRLVYTDRDIIETSIEFSYDFGAAGQWQAGIPGLELDMSRLAGLIRSWLPGQELSSGRLRAGLKIGGQAQTFTSIFVDGQLSDLSVDGHNVLEQITADIHLDAGLRNEQWSVSAAITVREGAMYLVPGVTILDDQPGFYLEIKDEPLSMKLRGTWSPWEQRLVVADLSYTHPGLMSLQGSGTLDNAGMAAGAGYTLKVAIDDLEQAFPIYLQPLLLQTSFSGIRVRGGVGIDLESRDQLLQRFNITFADVTVEDTDGRFGGAGLYGNLAMGKSPAPIRSTLGWTAMNFYRLPVGEGQVVFESSSGKVKVLDWKNVAVLDGGLQIDRFEMNNIGSRDFNLTIDAGLSSVSMKSFSRAMDWPLMSGNIAGAFSGLRYSANTLEMNGDITVQVFDGKVTLRDLRIADLFSQYSIFSTDIDIQSLDLEQLTDTYAFGRIEGSMSGSIRDLRLEDWRPAFFDARFETDNDDKRRHRISQKALNNLNELGGGLGGTMSKGFLRIFPSYAYGKLGLRCRLRNNIVELGGIKETDKGFYLLTRGGLLPPWVEVKAVGRSMSWNDLVDGLKQISAGEVKIE